MRRAPRAVVWLSSLVAVLAAVASIAGLAWGGGGGRATVTSVHGEQVELYGEGLYRYDTVFIGAASKGTDVVTLALGIPLLVAALVLARRGSVRAALLLVGALTYFLYVYASRSFANAYNGLFLVYVALFSASLFALVVAVRSLDVRLLASSAAERRHRGVSIFLVVCAVVTAIVWLTPMVASLAEGERPKLLDTYTTTITEALDLGVIVPTLLVATYLLSRRSPLGYVLAAALLVLLVLIAVMIAVQTAFQVAADVSFTTGEIVGPISGFLILALVALYLLARLLRDLAAVRIRAGMPRRLESGRFA